MTQKLLPKYKLDTYYAITIQPNDKLQFHGNKATSRIMKIRQHFYSLFQEIPYPYYINLEISEPIGSLHEKTTGGRLHYHGIIKFNTKKQISQFLLETQYQILRQSRLEISEIHDRLAWLKYVHKQTLISEDISILSNHDNESFLKEYLTPIKNTSE